MRAETHPERRRPRRQRKPGAPAGGGAPGGGGFTLLEVLISTALIALAMALLFASFHNVTRASQKGQAKLDRLRHGELVMDQLVRALRFAAFFENNPKKYAFWQEKNAGSPPKDVISWVTSSPAFIPPREGLVYGLHRLFLSIEDTDDGPALHAVAYPHLQDLEDPDFEERDPWLVSREVTGLEFRWYDQDAKSWEDEWEKENALPQFVEVTLTLRPLAKGDRPVEMTRVVQIPAGAFSRLRNRMTQPVDSGSSAGANTAPAVNTPTVIPGGGSGGGGNRGGGGPSSPGGRAP
ncbi:MAG: hypothetical protein U1F87_04450 [Kiritimatiellia bacterium]